MIDHPVIMAPMAGISEIVWRNLCRTQGAGLAYGAMLTAQMHLWHSHKSRERLVIADEQRPRIVQIVGHDPQLMAIAAQHLVEAGADIIDINMGCPAAKVCGRNAGSALLDNLPLLTRILNAVVNAVPVPVSLKIRTGVSPQQRNGVTVAQIAEQNGIQLLTVHGRTRTDYFSGIAEFSTLADIKKNVIIPVVANGDIRSTDEARTALQQSGADGIMIGRGALGRPWLFRQMVNVLCHGRASPEPMTTECVQLMQTHVLKLHTQYGSVMGLRHARKQVGWYLEQRPDIPLKRAAFMSAASIADQRILLDALVGQ